MCVDCTLMIPAELKCGCHYSPGMVQDNSWRTHPYKQAPAAETAQFSSSNKLFVLNLLLQYIQFVFALIVKVFGWLVTRCDTALLSFWLHFEPHSLCHTGPVFGGKAIDMSTVLSRQTPKTPAPLSYVHMNHLRKSVHTVKKKKIW